MTTVTLEPDTRVAIVDDVDLDAELTERAVRDAGLQPVVAHLERDLAEMVEALLGTADVAVCDHRLNRKVSYPGASLVESLMRVGMPAVLLTTFAVLDDDVDILGHRRYIPDILVRGRDSSSDHLIRSLTTAAEELNGHYSRERQPHRTVVRVESCDSSPTGTCSLTVPAWPIGEPVYVPRAALESVARDVKAGDRFLAEVNLFCTDPLDVYAANFEVLPPATLEAVLGLS